MGKKIGVGLDIGSSLVKVVEMELGKKTTILNYGIAAFLPDVIVDGEVMDREVVVDTIRNLFESKGIKRKDVITAMSGKGVITKKITMEKMKESEAKVQIRWEAEQHIPFDINDVTLDFEIVNPDAGENQMEVILAAAKKESVHSYVALLQETGLNPVIVDYGSFAVQNAFEANYEISTNELVALINIGSEKTNINFVMNGISHFTRDISVASNSCSQKLQRDLGLSLENAASVLKGEKIEEVDEASLLGVYKAWGEELAVGIDRTLPYLPGEMEKMDRIYLSGGGANIKGISDFLGERFGTPCEGLNSLKNIAYNPILFGTENPELIAPLLTQAVGLALRGRG